MLFRSPNNMGGTLSYFDHQCSTLFDSLRCDHILCARKLLERKEVLEVESMWVNSVLHEVVRANNCPFVKLFVECHVDLSLKDETGWTVFHVAAFSGYDECLKILLQGLQSYEKRVDLEQKCSLGTVLELAVLRKHVACARLLLDHGANGNTLHMRRRLTPLFLAAMQDDIEMVKLFIEYGVCPYSGNNLRTASRRLAYRSEKTWQLLLSYTQRWTPVEDVYLPKYYADPLLIAHESTAYNTDPYVPLELIYELLEQS